LVGVTPAAGGTVFGTGRAAGGAGVLFTYRTPFTGGRSTTL